MRKKVSLPLDLYECFYSSHSSILPSLTFGTSRDKLFFEKFKGPSFRYNASIRRIITLVQDQTCQRQVWWTRLQPIRTVAEIHAHVKVLPAKYPYLYQKLAQKATELHLLGMSYIRISKILGIDPKTVKKALGK